MNNIEPPPGWDTGGVNMWTLGIFWLLVWAVPCAIAIIQVL